MTKKKGDNITAILSYFSILFLVPLLAEKENDFAQYHARQGLVLFIAEVATIVVGWIPLLGWLVAFAGWILWVVLSIIGIINVVNKRKKPLPLVGKFVHNISGE